MTEQSAQTTLPRPLPRYRSTDQIDVERNEVVDVVLGGAPEGNPYDVEVLVALHGPRAAVVTVPAFWDPAEGFIVRISLPSEGIWTAVIPDAASAGLEGQSLTVRVTAGTSRRGPLLVDPDHPRHLLIDGEHFFFRGYEVDWLLMIDQQDPSLRRVKRFLDQIGATGFNAVTVNAYARSFRRHVPEDLERDPRWVLPAYAPWPGGNDDPDYGSFDGRFFDHMDRVLAELHDRGIVTHLMIHVYNKDVNWPELGSPDDDRFWRYVVSRYQAFPNILWDTAKESYHQSADYIWTRIALIRRYDGYGRLVTAHDVNPPAGHDWGEVSRRYTDPTKELLEALCDVIADQVLLTIYDDALARTTRFAKPYINVEFAYESGIDDLPSDAEDHDQDWQEVTRRHWQVVMGGAYPNYYYRNTAWSLFVPEPEPPGYAAIKVLADFWDGTRYWLMAPRNELVDSDAGDVYARGVDGQELVVYSQSGAPFQLHLDPAQGWQGTWLDPYTGQRVEAAPDVAGRYVPPWPRSAAVLHLTK